MPRKPPKNAIVAFKVEEELAEFLNKLPNKSAFIRKAIVAHLGMACPLCNGVGVVPRGIHDHYAPMLDRYNARKCDGCGAKHTFPRDVGGIPDEHRTRLEQFFRGGPFYCVKCFEEQPACDDCGWHIAPERVADHFRKEHTHL